MDLFAPSYFLKFRCLAEACVHNCCRAGWEIDIDDETLAFYRRHDEIAAHICTDSTPHFRLAEDGCCPLLDERGLCRVITAHGETALCQICRDHPRFRNFFDSRTEIGVGLTCEAAARLVLDHDFELIRIGEDGEKAVFSAEEADFFDYRAALLDKDVTALSALLPPISVAQAAAFFKTLERLDTRWDAVLDSLRDREEPLCAIAIADTVAANRLFDYFLFRHLHEFGVEFCVFCTYFILSIGGDLADNARLFSSEVEYSDDNALATAEFVTQ